MTFSKADLPIRRYLRAWQGFVTVYSAVLADCKLSSQVGLCGLETYCLLPYSSSVGPVTPLFETKGGIFLNK